MVTSYSPLLWLVIDATSKVYTHARRSHNTVVSCYRKYSHSTTLCIYDWLFVCLWEESVRYYCTVYGTVSLCFCCRQECI